MQFDFTYEDYDVTAYCQYDLREDGCYLGDINFEVYNSSGEDITCDINGLESIAIHQRVIEKAQQERDLNVGLGGLL